MFGSRKPNNEAYNLKNYYKLELTERKTLIIPQDVNLFNIEKIFTNYQLIMMDFR